MTGGVAPDTQAVEHAVKKTQWRRGLRTRVGRLAVGSTGLRRSARRIAAAMPHGYIQLQSQSLPGNFSRSGGLSGLIVRFRVVRKQKG
ncbi:hypothetical protein Bxe_A2059 [Paraburkholderia xenovorans LB400]|jgi:hypothetical protein|uniref:Uncharacterized protein n=1 Tax=Paraburkholderia xenovorans (strain LB400) TaxID=266265 RepID=Q13YD0_PARXL|nr:hypothetical protein Bxe_A2059 [Paraburkholderia xenovorans LB400]